MYTKYTLKIHYFKGCNMKKNCVQTSVLIPTYLYKEYKKRKLNLTKFVTEMLERELAGEFKQLKIAKLEQELASAKAEHVVNQTHHQKQQEKAKKSYEDAEAEMLERRRQNMLLRKEGI